MSYECCVCKTAFDLPKGETLKLHVQKNGVTKMFCSTECQVSKRQRHKYQAVPCEEDSIRFGSKAERAYYLRLKHLVKHGEVIFFLRQVPFDLPGNTKYFVDFQVFYADGTIAFVDVKGVSTPMFILKKKQVEDLYPIHIEVVH